jgi:heme/copper-type cytochrome/quinol oxidase subunit 1
MLPAKLFGALALIFAVCLWISTGRALPSFDIYLHATYFAFGPLLLLLYGSVICANFAVLYYATTRCWGAQWHRTLSLLHFSLVVLAAILFFVVAGSTHLLDGGVSNQAFWRVFLPGFLGALSFLASWLVFAVNLVWTAVRTVRARYAHH